jgi:hypothetical protein
MGVRHPRCQVFLMDLLEVRETSSFCCFIDNMHRVASMRWISSEIDDQARDLKG